MGRRAYYQTASILNLPSNDMGIVLRLDTFAIWPALHTRYTRFHFEIIYIDPFYFMAFVDTFDNRF